MDALQAHAPGCRLVLHELPSHWSARPQWPEFARWLAVVGTRAELEGARDALVHAFSALHGTPGAAVPLAAAPSRDDVVRACLHEWARLEAPVPASVDAAVHA